MDFSFAILPWFVVWDLNMKQKEKITVACGLSLGILYTEPLLFCVLKNQLSDIHTPVPVFAVLSALWPSPA